MPVGAFPDLGGRMPVLPQVYAFVCSTILYPHLSFTSKPFFSLELNALGALSKGSC